MCRYGERQQGVGEGAGLRDHREGEGARPMLPAAQVPVELQHRDLIELSFPFHSCTSGFHASPVVWKDFT